MTMQILMAYGANSACAPVAIFENKDDAFKAILPFVGEPTEIRDGEPRWECDYDAYKRAHPLNDGEKRNRTREAEEEWANKMVNFFSRYYDGCGGCTLILEPIEFGQLKRFTWDLD